MADVENPDPDLAAEPEPDEASEFVPLCVGACFTCAMLAISGFLVLLIYLDSADKSTAAQVMAVLRLGVALAYFVLGARCCVDTLGFCLHGNIEGEQQPYMAAPALD
ncbi:hypothetical protein ACUV84_035263 [Puccinellia chinampoensis]